MISIPKEKDCYGCSACVGACRVDAIKVLVSKEGFYYPKVDAHKCVNCKKCVSVCQVYGDNPLSSPAKCYAAIDILYENTASGGIATLIAKTFHKRGFEIFSIGFYDGKVKYGNPKTNAEWEYSKGSFYSHGFVEDVYDRVKQLLLVGNKVLFFGLPCVINALYCYIDPKTINNLYTVDLICHGAPPEYMLDDHISRILEKKQIKKDNVDRLVFRTGLDYRLKLIDKKQRVVYERQDDEDPYFLSFEQGLTLPKCCTTCKFASKDRIGDLTIGDFWGYKGKLLETYSPPISLILQNTQKGLKIIEVLRQLPNFKYDECDIEKAVEHNRALYKPATANKATRGIFKYYKTGYFERSVIRNPIVKYSIALNMCKNFLKRMIRGK